MTVLLYPAMRLRWCGLALRQFVRRWGVYLVVAALLAGAGSNSPVAAVAGLAGWLVLPLFTASSHGAWLLPALLLQALFGAALVWGARSLLWPAAWGEAERALPIDPWQCLRSDATVVAVALLPLGLLYAAGTGAVLAAHPAWLKPTQGRALAALVVAAIGSVVLGTALLQRLRRPRRSVLPPPPAGDAGDAVAAGSALAARAAVSAVDAVSTSTAAAAPHTGPVLQRGPWPWLWPLLLQPLWRGPARRTGQVLALGCVGLCMPGLALLRWPAAAPWCLAVLAMAALVVVTRARSLARDEFQPLFDACLVLPLQPAALQRACALLCLAPLLPAATAMGLGLAASASGTVTLRPLVLAAYALACLGSCVWEVLSTPAAAADKASRWIFSAVLCICLATEVSVS